ncbi:MAG: calycin-like domain-containing protein [Dysgonomonas sp.]
MSIMNKKLIYLLMLVFTLGLSFTACSDDDDDDNKVDYAKEIAATYSGSLTIPDMYDGTNDITLSRTATNKAKVELKDFVIPTSATAEITVGTISVDNIEVTKSGDTYTLKETTASVTIDLVPTPVDVKVSGTVKNNKLDLKIDVSKIPAFETLAITFAGTKK